MLKYGSNNIGRVIYGLNEIGKAYLGTNLVFSKGESPVAPKIGYIRNVGKDAYIDTGITPDETVKVIVWARNFNPRNGALLGSQVAVGSSSLLLGSYVNANTGELRMDYIDSTYREFNQFSRLSGYHKYEVGQGVLKVDDVTVISTSAGSLSNNYNIHLFGVNRGGSHVVNGHPADICAAQIYKNNVLVRDFVATDSPSVGLYDNVSQTLFTNANSSGSLVYGEFAENSYTPLEYIECSGEQYFDSLVYGSYNSDVVCVARPSLTTPEFHELLGYRSSNADNFCSLGFGNDTAANTRLYWRFGTASAVAYPISNTNINNTYIIIQKDQATVSVYNNSGTQIGTAERSGVSSSFQTEDTLYIGNINGISNGPFKGRLYYCLLGDDRSFVPALRHNVAGMYDLYNDVFYPSDTQVAFVAGPTI